MNTVIILMTHVLDALTIERYSLLKREASHLGYDIKILLNSDEPTTDIDESVVSYTIDQINDLGYTPIRESLYPGSCHFPVMAFAINNPKYDYIWFVEYDVVFTGCWKMFFCAFDDSDSDFISAYIERFDPATNNYWFWWRENNNVGYPLSQCLKSFNPVCRYSRRALEHIDDYLKAGHSAHSEVLIPTCLHNAGFKLEDFGGTGEFVKGGNFNRFYVQSNRWNEESTFRFRPEFDPNELKERNIPDKLYHPVKGLFVQ